MSKREGLLSDGVRSELMLQQHLKALSEAIRQQLQETEKRQIEELAKRIHQNALLSTDKQQESGDKKLVNCQAKHVEASVLNPDKNMLYRLGPAERADLSSGSVKTSMLAPAKTQQCERVALVKTTQMRKEEEAEAECQKKFCALPVPSHVIQPIYQEMMETREKERKKGVEERKNFLLSTQKPFCFRERKKEKMEKLVAMLNQLSPDHEDKVPKVRKSPHKVEKDMMGSELKDQEEVCRTVKTQATVQQENLSASFGPKLRTSERTRKTKLAFLDEKPTFQPKIIHQVPDFSRLHKALQTEALRKTQTKDVTKCQPFYLRTSALPERQRMKTPEKSQEPKKCHLSRSKSLGAITSLSPDTLPTFITDAVRKRSMAIRKSLEIRDCNNQESAEWLRRYEMRTQTMKKKVALHEKLLDPHSSLKDVYNEKLRQHMTADQQRMREYRKELQDMKARVSERPYLFERVKQRHAKALAEQVYRNTLKKAGFLEQFVEEKGAGTSASSRSDVNDHRCETDSHSREENVDDGEKIEDVEEESVKSKGEEMP